MSDARRGGGGERDRQEDLTSNLDALMRDVNDLEQLLDAASKFAAASGDNSEAVDEDLLARVESTPSALTYAQMTAYNRQRRADHGWGEPDLLALMDEEQREQLDHWRSYDRLPWTGSDLAAVGVSGLVAVLAATFDTTLDATVLSGLSWLKDSGALRQWEKAAARLPIDYTGPHFGGPAHRVRSAGHDIGRIFNALGQVRDGIFRGIRWEDGVKEVVEVAATRSGQPFQSASDPLEALALLMKHLAADFVTPMSLPLPGWSLLYEMPDRDLRKFAHDAYAGSVPGQGLNMRSGLLTPHLGVWVTELLIRTHVHLAAYRDSGSAALTPAATAKRTEMLLAAHSVAGAASLTKAAAAAVVEQPLAVRHVNVPVLLRTGQLALQLRRDNRLRAEHGTPSWEQVWADEVATWELHEAAELAALLTT